NERKRLMDETLHTASRRRLGRTIVRPGVLFATTIAMTSVGPVVGGGSSVSSPTTNPDAVAATPAGLRALGVSKQQPIYWVGPQRNVRYERTTVGDTRVLVRYLPKGAEIGSATPYLTVGTYIVPDAYAA